MSAERLHRLAQWSFVFLLAFSVLWKGGKSLETTWLLVVVAWGYVAASWWAQRDRAADQAKGDIPRLLWLPAVGFALWTILSFLVSETQNYGLDEVLRDGALAILLLSIIRDAHSDLRWRDHMLSVLAIAACVAAVIGMFVYVLQPVSRFTGTFFDHRFHTDYWPNAWAEFVLLGWPVVLWWALRTVVPVQRTMRLGLLGVLLGTLLLSYSRGALIAFGGQVVVGAFLITMFHRTRTREEVLMGMNNSTVRHVGCVIVLAIATFFLLNAARSSFFPVESVLRKATFTADEGTSSVSERSQFWQQAWTLSWQRPLPGHGPYSFRFLQPRLQEDVYVTSDHPHNVFLKLAMERGWPAALLFGLLCTTILLRTLIRLWRTPPAPMLLPGVLLIAVSGVLAHSLMDYNLQFVGIVLPLFLLLGIMESLHPPRTITVTELWTRRAVEVALVAMLFVLAMSEGRTLVLSSLGRHAEARGDAVAALRWYDASKHEVFSRDLHLSRASLLLAETRLDEAEAALAIYFDRNGEDARAWQLRGDLQRLRHDLPAALSAYRAAFARGRYNYLSILEGLLLTWSDARDRAALEGMEEEIVVTMRRFAEAIGRNTHFVALSDNVETFLRVVPMLSRLYPHREAELDVLAASVDRHAREERSRFAARRPGMLW